MHLFKNMEWTSSVILLGLGAGIYYAFSIVWPTQVAVLYGKPNDPMYTGYLSVIIGCGFIVGQTAAGLLAKPIGRQKWQIRIMFLVGGVFLACKLFRCHMIANPAYEFRLGAAVVQPDNKNTIIAVVFIGCVLIGWNESVTLTNATILVRDQKGKDLTTLRPIHFSHIFQMSVLQVELQAQSVLVYALFSLQSTSRL